MSNTKKAIQLVVVFVIFVSLKFTFTVFSVAQLNFLLLPISMLVSLFTGRSFTNLEHGGFYFESLQVTINGACSGYNFLLISFALLSTLVVVRYLMCFRRFLLILMPLFLGAYLLAIVANVARVCLTIFINSYFSVGKSELVHEAIGVTVFLSFLITTYLLFEKLTRPGGLDEKPDE